VVFVCFVLFVCDVLLLVGGAHMYGDEVRRGEV
jgi:hypothetical protein